MSKHDSPILRMIFFVCCHDFGSLGIRRLQNCQIADIFIIFLSTENLAENLAVTKLDCWHVILYLSTKKMDDDSISSSPSYLSPFFPQRQGAGRPFLRAAGTVSGESGCFAQPLPPSPITPTPNVPYSDSVSLRIWIFLAVKGKIGIFLGGRGGSVRRKGLNIGRGS